MLWGDGAHRASSTSDSQTRADGRPVGPFDALASIPDVRAGGRTSRIAPWAWSDWIRGGAEVEPSLYAADFRRLGEQIDALLAAGCRVFHFDCGDGHFVPPVTMGPVVLRSIAPGIHAAGACSTAT